MNPLEKNNILDKIFTNCSNTRLPERSFHTTYLQARSFHAVPHGYTPGMELGQLGV